MADQMGVMSNQRLAREMFQKAAGANQAPAAPQEYSMRLIIFKARRLAVISLASSMVVIFSILINYDMSHGVPWLITAVPISLLGMIWLLVPPTEEWEYKPWQSSPQQVERHYTE